MGVSATMTVEAYLSGSWVDITADTLAAASPLRIAYGIDGSGPADVIAKVGTCGFTLRNDAGGSGGVVGYYSPRSSNVRTGWGFAVPVRVSFSSGAISGQVKHRGIVTVIDPEPGLYGSKRVRVTSEDGMGRLLDAEVRELGIVQGEDEAQLMDRVLDAVPTDAQPVARDLDPGTNTTDVAFDDLKGGTKAVAIIGELVRAAQGRAFIAGDGTFVYRNRHNIGALATSAVTLNDTMHGLSAPSSVDRLYNRVRVTTRRKTVSQTATDLLYDGVVQVGGDSTLEVWTDYTDPSSGERKTKIGGVDVVTSLVAGTHYFAGPTEGGSESTASITPTLEAFSTSAKWTLVNSSTTALYVTLRVYGKAIRDLGPVVSEAVSVQPYGERALNLELKYQASQDFGGSLAARLLSLYEDLDNQIDSVSFVANDSATLMEQALLREPGDIVTITESVTGVTAATAVIQGVELTVTPPCWIRCTWRLAPADITGGAWELGTSALDSTTELAL